MRIDQYVDPNGSRASALSFGTWASDRLGGFELTEGAVVAVGASGFMASAGPAGRRDDAVDDHQLDPFAVDPPTPRTSAGSPTSRLGSGGRTRTYDQAVNSRPLYH